MKALLFSVLLALNAEASSNWVKVWQEASGETYYYDASATKEVGPGVFKVSLAYKGGGTFYTRVEIDCDKKANDHVRARICAELRP